jgi:hypothetical protein
LGNALWSDEVFKEGAQFNQHFGLNGFGNYVLDRARVISAVHAEIKSQLNTQPNHSSSVYLYGCRGMAQDEPIAPAGAGSEFQGLGGVHV